MKIKIDKEHSNRYNIKIKIPWLSPSKFKTFFETKEEVVKYIYKHLEDFLD
jgi:hypothetical protein